MAGIHNKGEQLFYNKMVGQGKNLVPQPYLKQFKMRPDFYCPEDDTYYEVIASRQAYHMRKSKIQKVSDAGFKISLVRPDGTPFFSKKPKPLKVIDPPKPKKEYRKGTQSVNIRRFPDDLHRTIKSLAASKGIPFHDFIIDLLKESVKDVT